MDVSDIIYEMRMIKDRCEIEAIKRAGEIASRVMEKTMDIIKPGVSETEIAGEAYYHAYRLGSEEPKVYVNIGPYPRVPAEPFRDIRVGENTAVTIVLGAGYNHYYTNMTRTIIFGNNDLGRKHLMYE